MSFISLLGNSEFKAVFLAAAELIGLVEIGAAGHIAADASFRRVKAKSYAVILNELIKVSRLVKLFGEKKVEMLHVKDLLKTTGYIRGGCSPVGMKKQFPTVIDETACLFDKIYVSAGVRGMMLGVEPQALADFVNARLADVTAVE